MRNKKAQSSEVIKWIVYLAILGVGIVSVVMIVKKFS